MMRFVIQGVSLFLGFLLMIHSGNSGAGSPGDFYTADPENPAFLSSDITWADSVLQSLSLDEKIAQLLMIASYSYMGEDHVAAVSETIKKYNVGGIIFMKGSPVRQAQLTNLYQSLARTPLMISMDAEWGLSMRLDSTVYYPWQMMMGAIQDDALIYQMGYDIGRQLRRLGVHVNFAPVVDINNNPSNPVINARSFGEDKFNVARKAWMYARGLEDAGIIAVYKHFPGHGDTDTDSHYTLPLIAHDSARLDSVEFFPFSYGIKKGIQAVMTAHLQVPSLDSSANRAASLSPLIIRDQLMGRLGFGGLIFTDALSMKGVSDFYRPGEVEAEAFLAGNDILLMPDDVPKAVAMIRREIKRGQVSEEELDRRCRKVLQAKYWLGLSKKQEVRMKGLVTDLNNPFYEVEKEKFILRSVTLVKNSQNILPLRNIENFNMVSLSIGNGQMDEFGKSLRLYKEVDDYYVSSDQLPFVKDSLTAMLKKYNTLVLSIHNTSRWPARNYGMSPFLVNYLNELDYNGNLILCYFGNPYGLAVLEKPDMFDAIVVGYEDRDEVKQLTAQLVFGAYGFSGKLPVSAGSVFPVNSGLSTTPLGRLSYGVPESVMISSAGLKAIDSIVNRAISMKATPGCQVLVSRKGKVVFNKSYGYQTFQNKVAVDNEQIYDLASLTKITATLPCLMKLEDEGRFSVDNRLGDYLNFPDSCNKKDLIIRDILAHQSGLPAWIPFYYKTLEPLDTSENLLSSKYSDEYPIKIGTNAYMNRNIVYRDSVFETVFSDEYPIRVAQNLYLRKDFRDSIYNSILNCELMDKSYRYSDLGYYLFQEIIENETGSALYPLLYKNFYSRIGASSLGYLPLNRFPKSRIVPTENDIIFRHQLLQGYVHDPGAAMLGGVAGHAGLFSNANDLAKFLQMYLNGGIYGGVRYISDSTLQKYTTRVFTDNGNRRALGFDKPEPKTDKISPASKSASLNSYGHTGFTGTMAWIDPDYELVYVFLSNRIHPNQYNAVLSSENVRTEVQEAIYKAIIR